MGFMNFLAHLYLSPENEDILVGNFMADAIKGNSYLKFNKDIQRGIRLHRKIDEFTDKHPLFRQSTAKLKPTYRLYSSVIVDIYYDHFLARNWDLYAEVGLIEFAAQAYKILAKHYLTLPARYKRILPFMIAQNWLVSYASFWSLERVFHGMSRRTGYRSGMENAVTELKQFYHDFEEEFHPFFKEIISFVSELKY